MPIIILDPRPRRRADPGQDPVQIHVEADLAVHAIGVRGVEGEFDGEGLAGHGLDVVGDGVGGLVGGDGGVGVLDVDFVVVGVFVGWGVGDEDLGGDAGEEGGDGHCLWVVWRWVGCKVDGG